MQKDSKKELSEVFSAVKQTLTFKFPYWATILLLIPTFNYIEIMRLQSYLLFLVFTVASFQEAVYSKMPKWLVYSMRSVFLVFTILFLLEKLIRIYLT